VKFARDWGNASTEGLKSYGLGLAYAVRNLLQNKTARPIYFIPHSLGGLVVEQALLESIGSDVSLHNVSLWTAGILFFGVPHQGSHLAKWGSALRKMIPQSIRSSNKKVIDALKSDSEVCQNLESDFQKEAKHGKLKKIRLFSFYETRKLPGFSNLVVPEKSAVLKADFKCAIEGDHKSMTRFTGPNDPEYCKVKGQLIYWLLPENSSALDEVPKKKKKKRSGISVQGATITGTFNGPVNAASNFATRDFYVTQGPNSTQQIIQSGGRADQDSSDEYGEPSSSGSETEEEDEDEEEMFV
jgi:protein SERAC1